MSQIVEKNTLSSNVKESIKIPVSGTRRGWLPKFNHFSLSKRYISGKIFTKMRSAVFRWSC